MKRTNSTIPTSLAIFAEDQVIKQVLPFWQASAIKPEGGLYGAVSQSGVADMSAPQGAILNARALWSFAHAFEQTGDSQYLGTASQLFKAFAANFIDPEQGGVYWCLNADGSPQDDHKHVVAQAYALFAISMFYQVSQDSYALELAQSLVSLTQKHFLRLDGTYLTQLTRNFDGHYDDTNDQIETCNQLHMLEAITQYIKSSQDTTLTPHLEDLIDLFLLRIFPAQDHLALRFTANWAVTGNELSYGHNFEAAFLVCLACSVLDDEVRLAKTQKHLIRLVDLTIEQGKHASGSYLFGLNLEGKPADTLFWWTQTEASNALILAAQITNNDLYYSELTNLWESIRVNWVDEQQGEWFSELNQSLEPAGNTNKVDLWRCSYHTTRACFFAAQENQNGNTKPTLTN